MGFKIRTFEELTAKMIEFIKGETDRLTDFHIGSKTRTIIESVAIVLEQYYHRTWHTLKTTIEDNVYKAFSFDREQPRSAVGYVQFYRITSPAGQDYIISAGTRLRGGTLLFETMENAVLRKGESEVSVPVKAVEPGVLGNVPASTITEFVIKPAGIEGVTNPSALTQGRDLESRDTRKKRFGKHIEALHKGTIPALHYAVTLDDEVLEAVVVENPELFVLRNGIEDISRHCEDPFSAIQPTILPETLEIGNTVYFGSVAKFQLLLMDFTGIGSGYEGVWEVFTGTEWETLTVDDGTAGLTQSGTLAFEAPTTWQGDLILGREAFWLRFRITGVTTPVIPKVRYIFCDPPPGYVDIYIQPTEGETLTEELRNRIIENLKSFRGAGITINLRDPNIRKIEVHCDIRVRREYAQEVVAEQVRNAIHGYFSKLHLGQSFYLNDLLFEIRNIDGILDVFIAGQQSTIFAGAGDILRTDPSLIHVTVVV